MNPDTCRISLIYNPRSGLVHSALKIRPIENIINFFNEKGISLDIKTTAKVGDGTRLAREAAVQGYDYILAGGGDGTVSEVVNGILDFDVTMGIIPLGTENVFCKSLNVPLNVAGACEHFYNARVRNIDIPVANEHNYLMMSGIGLDAHVISETESDLKNALGGFGYVLKGAGFLFSHLRTDGNKPRVKIKFNDLNSEIETPFWIVLVGNQCHYSGTMRLTTRAKMDDGLLDVLIFPYISKDRTLQQLVAALTERHLELAEIQYFKSADFIITTDRPILCQADGEIVGETPIHYRVKPGALKMKI